MICYNCENQIPEEEVAERCPTCGIRIVDLTQGEPILFKIQAKDRKFSGIAEFIAKADSVAAINNLSAQNVLHLNLTMALEPSETGTLYTLKQQGVEGVEEDGAD